MSGEKDRGGRSVKQLIETAFLQLLEEKPYPDISVTDIITKAGVARVSYYRNYSSISDVMDSITDRFAQSFIHDLVPLFDMDDDEKLRSFIGKSFLAISQSRNNFRLPIEINRGILFSTLEEKVCKIEQLNAIDTLADKYGRRAKIAMINQIGRKWVFTGMREPLDEMVDYVMSIIKSF